MRVILDGFVYFFLVLLIYTLITIWPVWEFLRYDFLTGKHLIIFTNEAEARPCGGFVTAVGTFRVSPFELEFKNVYAFENKGLGEAEYPLTKVASEKMFWDLGLSSNLKACSDAFRSAYEELTEEDISHVVLVDFSTVEEVFSLFGGMSLGEDYIEAKNLFALLTRKVADVDRHDEEALQNRKKPLAELGKKLIFRSFFNPTIPPRITRIVRKNLKLGKIYTEKISPVVSPEKNDFYVSEWNLGGAKTSRFLKKTLKVLAREDLPGKWTAAIMFTAENLGGIDEPVSQDWKGVFEVQMPEYLGGEKMWLETEIVPGEIFQKEFLFTDFRFPKNRIYYDFFSVFKPRGQKLYIDFSLSLFPQKTYKNPSFPTHENVGEFFGEAENVRNEFTWKESTDMIPPFITLHEFIPREVVAKQTQITGNANLFAEIHFNEKIRTKDDFKAFLVDRNFTNEEVSENPVLRFYELLGDGRTLILGFNRKVPQLEERYYLEISGVVDFWKNEIDGGQRTLIER